MLLQDFWGSLARIAKRDLASFSPQQKQQQQQQHQSQQHSQQQQQATQSSGDPNATPMQAEGKLASAADMDTRGPDDSTSSSLTSVQRLASLVPATLHREEDNDDDGPHSGGTVQGQAQQATVMQARKAEGEWGDNLLGRLLRKWKQRAAGERGSSGGGSSGGSSTQNDGEAPQVREGGEGQGAAGGSSHTSVTPAPDRGTGPDVEGQEGQAGGSSTAPAAPPTAAGGEPSVTGSSHIRGSDAGRSGGGDGGNGHEGAEVEVEENGKADTVASTAGHAGAPSSEHAAAPHAQHVAGGRVTPGGRAQVTGSSQGQDGGLDTATREAGWSSPQPSHAPHQPRVPTPLNGRGE